MSLSKTNHGRKRDVSGEENSGNRQQGSHDRYRDPSHDPVDRKTLQNTGHPRLDAQWLWDTASREFYWDDPQSDIVVFKSGRRLPRARLHSSPFTSTIGPGTSSQPFPANAGYHYGTAPGPSPVPRYLPSSEQQLPVGSMMQGLQRVSLRESSSSRGPQAAEETSQTVTKHLRAHNGQSMVTFQDPASQVQIAFVDEPAERITDPALLEMGKQDEPRKFFSLGKVFEILWVEPAGEANIDDWVSSSSQGRHGPTTSAKVRRFVVIREGDAYCSALPINTYGAQGVGKPEVMKSEHAIIYTGKQASEPMPSEQPTRGESGMHPQPIQIDADDRTEKLDETSRLHLGSVHTIQHNIKVKSFGKVHPKSLSALLHQFSNTWRKTRSSSSSPAASQVENDSGAGAVQVQGPSGLRPSAQARHVRGPMTSASQTPVPSNSQSSSAAHHGSGSGRSAVQAPGTSSARRSVASQNWGTSSTGAVRAPASSSLRTSIATPGEDGSSVARIAVNRLMANGYSEDQAMKALREELARRRQAANAESGKYSHEDDDDEDDDEDEDEDSEESSE